LCGILDEVGAITDFVFGEAEHAVSPRFEGYRGSGRRVAQQPGVGFEQEGELEQLVVSNLKEHLWELMKREGEATSRLLRASEELKKELLEMVLEDDEAGLRGFGH